jgi:hypothetical protein
MRVFFLPLALTLALVAATASAADLPVGPNPPALDFPHFPSRLHAFVWRNWNLVETARLAKVLETTPDNVRTLAGSMRLPPEQPVPPLYRDRLYLSIIRRNWHLLPYDQLLVLLDMTADQLAHTLREDDFLWIKLGSLKPRCEKLVYAPPDAAAEARCRDIARLIRENFPPDPAIHPQRPFAFLDDFGRPIPDAAVRPTKPDPGHPRFLYSYFAVFGDPLANPALDPYPDALLQRYADLGVNGVWLHVVLRDLAPSADFPEFGAGHGERLKNLAKLVARAKRFNIGIYLYTNEPRAMPLAFFDKPGHQELKGVVAGDYATLCTSTPRVRKWLGDSLAHVFTAVPDLAGVFTITASENLTNCASHGHKDACPRCKTRSTAAIIAEVNTTIEQAVHRAAPKADVIAWDWGWPDAAAPDVIAALSKSVYLQSVSEWSLPLNRGGVKTTVGEYSISAVGPGPRATKHWQLAKSRGLKTTAKVQASNTWELSAVPYLPTYDLVAQHATNLAKQDVDGLQLSWSLGGYPSPNLELFQRITRGDDREAVLNDLATRAFSTAAAPHARKAWTLFSQAFAEFPDNGAVLYNAPQQVGPANLLYAKPTGYRASMVGFPYDDLTSWRGPYPADVFISQLRKVTTTWQSGLADLTKAADAAPPALHDHAQSELRLARAALLHFESVANQAEFVEARAQFSRDRKGGAKATLRTLLDAESRAARDLYSLQLQDPRIGFEASNHYYYLPQDLQEKFLNCQHLLTTLPTTK